nr:MAG TPA: hypothetical protein [Caudoviricetes sp.]
MHSITLSPNYYDSSGNFAFMGLILTCILTCILAF